MTVLLITDERFDQHDMPGHPEHAGRLQAVRQQLVADDLLERTLTEKAQPVDLDLVRSVHVPEYVAQLERTAHTTASQWLDADTYATPRSFEVALLAAGAATLAVGGVLKGTADRAIALVRPPGHHATRARAMGFCLINNIAVAARFAQQVHRVERIAIVDYDVHHGNGTQDIFYEDSSVLYISTHQSPLYPGTGSLYEMGRAGGEGCTLNIPLPPGVGDEGYERVFERVILPALQRFAPELILASVGFDAHWADPLANMTLSLQGYHRLCQLLIESARDCCKGRIVFVMEGGYHLGALSHGWANIVRATLGDADFSDPLGPAPAPSRDVSRLIEQVRHTHGLP
jgi:acetoin utilization deacetylase AcuC-like enzyme